MRRLLAFLAAAIGVAAGVSGLAAMNSTCFETAPAAFASAGLKESLELPRLSSIHAVPDQRVPDQPDPDQPESEAGVYQPAGATCRVGLAAARRITRKMWSSRAETGEFQPLVIQSFLKLPVEHRYTKPQVVLKKFERGPPSA
jgi:hypothetical protein